MMHYFVRSDDGQDYRVGRWHRGRYIPGTRDDALREARLLRAEGEPTAYAWGTTRFSTSRQISGMEF